MRIWQKFKFGIADVDGTIFDNIEICADAFLEVAKEFPFPRKEARKIYIETNGMNLNDQFKLIFDKYGIRYNSTLISDLNKKYFTLRDNWEKWQNAPLFPGVRSLLETLRENGMKLFISSGSNGEETTIRFEKAGILEYFDLILGGEKIPKGQRHFDIFANFCKLTPQKFASQTFLLSDGPNDMKLAKNAGIFALGITNTVSAAELKSNGANIVISSAEKIKNLEF